MNNQHTPESSERRVGERLQIDLPMELGNGHGNGRTRDVSASGVYFETEASLTAGAPIRFSFVLDHVFPTPLRLECEGQIIRVERREGKLGVAAAMNSYRLLPQEQHTGLWNEQIDDDWPRQDRRPESSQDLNLVGRVERRPTMSRVKEYLGRFRGGWPLGWLSAFGFALGEGAATTTSRQKGGGTMKLNAKRLAMVVAGGVMMLLLASGPAPVAFAQSQTAQSIMVELDYDGPAYEIVGTITWTYQRNTCAVPLYTAHAGVWDGNTPTCSGSTANCAPSNQPAVPPAPAIPTTGPNSVSNHAQDDRCIFFCGGNVSGWNYTQTETVPGLNGKGNWTFTYNYTTDGAGAVAAETCWSSQVTGGSVDVGFEGFVCSESFLKQSTRNKYSFTLLGPEGSRVSNVQVELQQFDGTNWNTVSGPVLVPETDSGTGQLPVSAATEDFNYFGNGGGFGKPTVLTSLHYSGGKAANSVNNILNGINDGTNSDNFAGNNNDLADGKVHLATFTGQWEGLTDPGTYRTVVTGVLKGNSGQADIGFSVGSNLVVIGGCTCGS